MNFGEQKRELEDKIMELLVEFEKETGVCVKSIDIRTTYYPLIRGCSLENVEVRI